MCHFLLELRLEVVHEGIRRSQPLVSTENVRAMPTTRVVQDEIAQAAVRTHQASLATAR